MYLEYRTEDEQVLFHYHLEMDEAEIRKKCDYLVKERIVYETTGHYQEPGLEIIYVIPSTEEVALNYGAPTYQTRYFPVELRRFDGEESFVHPLIAVREATSLGMVRTIISQPFRPGEPYTGISSVEMDEDRGCLVIYLLQEESVHG